MKCILNRLHQKRESNLSNHIKLSIQLKRATFTTVVKHIKSPQSKSVPVFWHLCRHLHIMTDKKDFAVSPLNNQHNCRTAL